MLYTPSTVGAYVSTVLVTSFNRAAPSSETEPSRAIFKRCVPQSIVMQSGPTMTPKTKVMTNE